MPALLYTIILKPNHPKLAIFASSLSRQIIHEAAAVPAYSPQVDNMALARDSTAVTSIRKGQLRCSTTRPKSHIADIIPPSEVWFLETFNRRYFFEDSAFRGRRNKRHPTFQGMVKKSTVPFTLLGFNQNGSPSDHKQPGKMQNAAWKTWIVLH